MKGNLLDVYKSSSTCFKSEQNTQLKAIFAGNYCVYVYVRTYIPTVDTNE